jgi:DNA modification methylase
MIMGGSTEEKLDHPTQKPVELMRRPFMNHTRRGDVVWEPFLGYDARRSRVNRQDWLRN